MEARELRVGNWVEALKGNAKIAGVDKTDERGDYVTFVGDYKYGQYIEHDGVLLVKPIPLTEEWLEKLGAYKREDGNYLRTRFLLIWKPAYNYWYVLDSNDLTYFTKLEFVHEWQNFYFIMNGEELELR